MFSYKKPSRVGIAKFVLSSVAVFSLASCAKLTTATAFKPEMYDEPKNYTIRNTSTLNMSKDDVWDNLVRTIGGTYYVINNMEKDSGFMNISYSGEPQQYIDCGYWQIQKSEGKPRVSYDASSKFLTYKIDAILRQDGELLTIYGTNNMFREMDLSGRINVLVIEKNNNQVDVTVNVRYVVTNKIERYHTLPMTNQLSESSKDRDTFGFSSKNIGISKTGIKCRSKGTMEAEILDIASS